MRALAIALALLAFALLLPDSSAARRGARPATHKVRRTPPEPPVAAVDPAAEEPRPPAAGDAAVPSAAEAASPALADSVESPTTRTRRLRPPPEHLFPRPPALEPRIDLWRRAYGEVDANAGMLHDSEHLEVVYEVIEVPTVWHRRKQEQAVRRAKQRYATILKKLATGRRSGLSREEQQVLALWPEGVSNGTLAAAARRIRFQRGLADKFRDGIVRSGRWEDHIRQVFQEQGLPAELAALPHVESSYNPRAYSKAGAAGLWQFTRSTGRLFLRIDYTVDERYDPFRATEAAAELLRHNYEKTGTWPLAITSYNHGTAGMLRAIRKLGTRDIDVIVARYEGRTFGFASRNFYAEFLAALDVEREAERYFGELQFESPASDAVFETDAYYPADALASAFGVDLGLLQEFNLPLRQPVWTGQKYVPKGYPLRLPHVENRAPLAELASTIPDAERFAKQRRDRYYTVRRGDTLSRIARRYDTSQHTLMELNGLRNRHRIRAGQRLHLPEETPAPGTRRSAKAVKVEPAWVGDSYRVRRGETLSVIARRVGLSIDELAAANDLSRPDRIRVGQVLKVPASDAAASRVARSEPKASEVPRTASDLAATPEPDPAASFVARSEPKASEVPQAASELATIQIAASSEPKAEVRTTTPVSHAATPEPLGATLTTAPTTAAELVDADPERWSVRSDDTALVQPEETLGHFADWLEVSASRLRRLNGKHGRSDIASGQRLKLDFSRVSVQEFEARRIAHHRALREDFLARHRIAGTEEHVLRRGETLWELSHKRYRVPVWLLRDYNPDLDPGSLRAGLRLTIPRVERRT